MPSSLRWICTVVLITVVISNACADIGATTALTKSGQGQPALPTLGNLDCTNAIPVPCPGVVSGQSIEQPNNVTRWTCGFIDPGGELVYSLWLGAELDVTITILDHDAGCIDVYFVETCNEQPCVWIGYMTGDSRTIHGVGPGMVYVVVDRWVGCSAGPYGFELEFECSTPPPTCDYAYQCTEDLGRLDWYADGEWSSRDGLIYQVYRGGFVPAVPDIVVYDPETCDIIRTYELSFTPTSQRGIAVDTRNGYIWVAGWWDRVIYYIDDDGNWVHTFGGDYSYAGLAYDADNERLWAVTNSAPDKYLVFDVQNPLAPTLLWGPRAVPWQCGGTFAGTNFNGAGLEYSPLTDNLIFINQDAAAQECFHDNNDGMLIPLGCCPLAPLTWPWGCALVDGEFGQEGGLHVTSLDEWPCGPWAVEVFQTVCDAPVPVELVSFQATGRDGYITLCWTTASEVDNDLFVLYKRKVGEADFQVLARIPGHGTTSESHNYSFVDRWVRTGVAYQYRISDVDLSGQETFCDKTVHATTEDDVVPTEFALYQNHPNPFNLVTEIAYDVKEEGRVILKIYNLLGQEVRTLVDAVQAPQRYHIRLDGSGLASGIYLYTLRVNDFYASRKMILLR